MREVLHCRLAGPLALQVGTLTELNAVRAVMTEEQKRDFRTSTLALSVGLFVSVASALVASLAILVVQLRNERCVRFEYGCNEWLLYTITTRAKILFLELSEHDRSTS